MHISSGPIDRARAQEDLELYTRLLADLRPRLADGDTNLLGAADLALRRASALVALRPDDPSLRSDIQLISRAMAGFFALARASGGPIDVPVVDERSVRLEESRVDWAGIDPYRWMQGWYAATLVDDVESLALLCSTPIALLRKSPTRVPEFAYKVVEGLSAFWNGAPEAVDMLLDALQTIPPDDDAALRLHAPPVDLLLGLRDGDPDRFDRDLVRAIEQARGFWSLPAVIKAQERWFDYRLAAVARRGVLSGFPVRVTADTIPDSLVRAPRRDELMTCCPYCVTPIAEGTTRCPACLEDPSNDAAFEATASEYEDAARMACPTCAYRVLEFAVRCPRCRSRTSG